MPEDSTVLKLMTLEVSDLSLEPHMWLQKLEDIEERVQCVLMPKHTLKVSFVLKINP